MAISITALNQRKRRGARIGLALAGGGPLGGIYEIGALKALDEVLEGADLHQLDAYVGVSAGAFIAASLANGFSIAEIARIFIAASAREHPIRASIFLQPAWREYGRRLLTLPSALASAVASMVRNPLDMGLGGALNHFTRAIPTGVLDNEPLQAFLADLYRTRGHTNDFRRLRRKLYVVAADLDTGESVRFGSKGYDHVPISRAVQASTALPGLYPPVLIDGRYFVDGALKRTLHASAALEEGADLLLCINPLVPYDANAISDDPRKMHEKLVDGGLPVVLSQTFRAIIHSRMNTGMKAYESTYTDRDILLLEPDREDSRMFFSNLFSYSSRRHVCEHAYQTTRADLLKHIDELEPLLARHGVGLRRDVLTDPKRRFDSADDVPEEVRRRGFYKNETTNELSTILDSLEQRLSA